MDDRAPQRRGLTRDHLNAEVRTDRSRRFRLAYLVVALILIAWYPLLPTAGRNAIFLLAAVAAIPAVLAAMAWINPGHRRFWVLLLAALVLIGIANVGAIYTRGTAVSINGPFDAAGNVLLLIAALELVRQQARNNVGSIVDTSIAALSVGGVLWALVLGPNLLPAYQSTPDKLAFCVLVIALCGVLGALGQVVIARPVPAVGPLIAGLGLALTADVLVAVTTDQRVTTAAGMMFVGAYTAVALFSLDPSASQLLTPAPARADTLSLKRLVFLAVAVAIVPIVVGARQIASAQSDGLVLVICSAASATLVMVRIRQLSSQRDRAEQAIRYQATHDPLTGLPNRRQFVTQLGEALACGEPCTVVFCDLDRFKAVNDGFGHRRGDEVLIEVAQRLRGSVRTHDVVSRFGGDEFVILIRASAPDEVQIINRRIVHALSRPVATAQAHISIGVTTGAATAAKESDPEDLISRADRAMYTAKKSAT
jgi:diguanylate cyclase